MKLASLSDKGIGPRPDPVDRAVLYMQAIASVCDALRLVDDESAEDDLRWALSEISALAHEFMRNPRIPGLVITTIDPETDIGASA